MTTAQLPGDPNDPTIWFHRWGRAMYAPSAQVPVVGGYEAYDALVERLAEANSREDLSDADRAWFDRAEAEVNAGGNPHLQGEFTGDWAAEDALEDADDTEPQVKSDDEDDWVGL